MIIDILDGKVAYYHAPKCASRTLLGWAALLQSANLLEEKPEWFAASRREEYPELRRAVKLRPESRHDWADDKMVPRVDAPVRLCIVREPIERFISGYTNRVLYHQMLGEKTPSLTQFITDFRQLQQDQQHKALTRHFLPQTCFYGRDPSLFTHVFNMRQLDQLKSLLEQIAGTELPSLQLQQSGGQSKPELSAKDRAWVEQEYAEDYAVFATFF